MAMATAMVDERRKRRSSSPGNSPELCVDERALMGLLGHRYGDGLVYMQGSADRLLFRQAVRLGFVNEEGYLTPSGYRFWRMHEC